MPSSVLSDQDVLKSVQGTTLAEVDEVGMARFFSPTNLSLLRRLASDEIATAERSRVLEALA